MWLLEHAIALTLVGAVFVSALASATYIVLLRRFPGRGAAAMAVTGIVAIAAAIVVSAGLTQVWQAKRDRDARVSSARLRHLHRLQRLLREESVELKAIAGALHDGRYFALVANDARKAVWQDETLTADVERHFPQYFHQREGLIDAVVAHDGRLARARQIVSAALTLPSAAEPFRSDVVQALVRKCAGTGTRPEKMLPTPEAVAVYEGYRCSPDVSQVCRTVFDRAEDLADAALLASDAAGRYAEETVLRGSCTYAPGE